MQFDKQILQTAINQTFSLNVSLNGDEKDGGKWFTAITKAQTILEQNFSIQFDGIKLSFASLDSNKTRIVTKDGCSNLCECGNQISYHRALFEIVSRYSELEKKAQRIAILDGAVKRIYTRQTDGNLKQTAEYVNGVEAWKIAQKTQKYVA